MIHVRLYLITFLVALFTANLSYGQLADEACYSFTELPDPTADTLSDWSGVTQGLHGSFVTIDQRFAKSLVPAIEARHKEKIKGWRGERVSAQILLWTVSEIPEATVQLSDFRSPDGDVLPSAVAEVRFVRYVMTDEFASGCGHRKPEDFAASLSADMLDNLDCLDLESQKARPVWITVDIPRDARAGQYSTTIVIQGTHIESISLQLELEVVDHVLPESSSWAFHLDQWQHPSAVARVEGLDTWSEAHFEALKPVMQMLVDAGQKVITATVNKDPWNNQCYDPYADMIVWTKHNDGQWSYDYTVFDRWIEFMTDLGIKEMINCYSIIPWNNEIHYRDEVTGVFKDVVAKPGTPVFEEYWKPFLQDFSKHLAERGWLEKTNIAIDERDRESMDAALKLLKEVAPGLGVSFADNKKTYQRYPDSRDISVSVHHPFDPADIIERRERGLNTTFYICCSDAFPNQFTFSDPAESAYLGWYTLAANFDGLLRWAFNSWVEKPMEDSRFRTWPAGDTYIVYPGGRSSIRYERMLEGIQDYEKVRIVRDKLAKLEDNSALSQLDEAIQKLNNPERREGWNNELNEAKELLHRLSKVTAAAR